MTTPAFDPQPCVTADGGGGGTPQTLAAQHQLVTPGVPWTPPVGATITSLTYTVLTGTGDVLDSDGGFVSGIPAGMSATFTAEDSNTLDPPQAIESVGGQVYVHWTTR